MLLEVGANGHPEKFLVSSIQNDMLVLIILMTITMIKEY